MTTIRRLAQLDSRYDLVVIGAGPAGIGAACHAAARGLNTLVVDENPTPGGQIYRSLSTTPLQDRTVLGTDYWRGEAILEDFYRSDASYVPESSAWSVRGSRGDRACEVLVSLGGSTRLIEAGHVILATGALERPFPIPGWTLPGVLSAGGAQSALKNAGVVPQGRVVVAGCGPLIVLLIAQLRRAGTEISAWIDTTVQGNWLRALPATPDFLFSRYASKGLSLLREATRGLKVVRGVTDLQAHGRGRVESILATQDFGTQVRLPADTLLLHQGVVPNINLSAAIGCHHRWNEEQATFVPRLDSWLASDVPGISVAGDGAGIAGAEAALLRGHLAAQGGAIQLGVESIAAGKTAAESLRGEIRRASRGRRFLDALYRPATLFRVPTHPDAIVCRCEEVTAARVREAIELGATGPNQLKTFLRCGMGPCQGRFCGLTVTELIAQARGVHPEMVGYYRLRPPVKPVTVAEVAAMTHTAEAIRAVER